MTKGASLPHVRPSIHLQALQLALSWCLMLSVDDLRFVTLVATSPSLAAVSRALDVTPSAVTQRLRQIERRLDLRLLNRSGRRLDVTDEGQLLVQGAHQILESLERLEAELAARRGVVIGQLRVLAPFGFGRKYVAPTVARFRRLYPGASLSLVLSDRPIRDIAESWDVLLHIGEATDSTLVARRVAPNERILCAAPAYIAARGLPKTPEELGSHDCIALRENDEDVTLWRLTHAKDGRTATVRIRPVISSNDGDVVRGWGVAGLGVFVRSEWDVADSLRSGNLTRILPDWRLPAADVLILLRSRSGRTAKIRRFVDCLVADLKPVPWRT
jgi:DNA-binding transcriptional LysR family regulator